MARMYMYYYAQSLTKKKSEFLSSGDVELKWVFLHLLLLLLAVSLGNH
jgi:hypothetical protein